MSTRGRTASAGVLIGGIGKTCCPDLGLETILAGSCTVGPFLTRIRGRGRRGDGGFSATCLDELDVEGIDGS